MNKKLFIIGAIFVIIVGTLWHFVYEWSGDNLYVGLIAPVNESVWEHMKIVFFPMLIFGVFEYFYLKKSTKNFFFSFFIKQISAIIFIIAVFYLYNIYTHESILVIDISSFVVAVILAEFLFYKLIVKKSGIKYEQAAKLLIIILFIFFLYATISPPNNQLFQDPVSGGYGIISNR